MKIRISLPENVSRKLKTSAFTFLLLFTFYLLLPAQAKAGWEWINPLPQGDSLNNIVFVGKDLGWCIGYFGTIYQTTDGGKNWTVTKTDFTTNLRSVCFADANNGWVCGDSGKIYYTSDGNIWKEQTTNTSLNLKAISFCDKNNGFAAGEGGLVLTTGDGGKHWLRLKNAPYGIYTNVNCISPGVGYFCALHADFIKTTDAGQSWDRKKLIETTTINKMKFLDSLNGYLACNYGVIFNTTDGGTNWDMFNPYTSLCLKEINFFDAKNGIAVGDNGYILNTTNAGKTWIKQPGLPGINFSGIFLVDFNLAYASCFNGFILKTTDFGITWEFMTKSSIFENLTSVYFMDSDTGFVGGKMIYKTTDGGKTWESKSKLDINNVITSIPSIKFYDKKNGWALANSNAGWGAILITTDGGDSWSYNFIHPVYDFCIVDKNTLFYCGSRAAGSFGNDKVLAKSTDGGNNWEFQFFRGMFVPYPFSIAFFDSLNGYAEAAEVLFSTTNGGISWSWSYDIGLGRGIFRIIPINSKLGWAVGRDFNYAPLISKTTDAGKSWVNIVPKEFGYNIYDGFFADSLNGWLLVEWYDRKILRTTDGGYSWLKEKKLTSNFISNFYFLNAKTGFVVGDNGTILKYTGDDIVNVEEETIAGENVDIEIYPNPTSGYFNIYINSTEPLTNNNLHLHITDIIGRTVYEESFSVESGNLSKSINPNLQSGVYFVQVMINGRNYSSRLVVGW